MSAPTMPDETDALRPPGLTRAERVWRAADARMRGVYNDYHQPPGWEPGQPMVYSPGERASDLPPLTFSYRNYRGEVAERRVRPISVRYGSTEWYPEPQWLLRAYDLDKQAEREFAWGNIGASDPTAVGWLQEQLRDEAKRQAVIDAAREWLTDRNPEGIDEERLYLALSGLFPEDFTGKEGCSCDAPFDCDECLSKNEVEACLSALRTKVAAAEEAGIGGAG